jgi:hypothetical protein
MVSAHHGQVLGGLVARSVARGQAGQRAADLHVEVLLGDDLVDEVVRAPRAEHGVGGREGKETFLGHAAGRGHQQLLRHAHLEIALGILLREEMQVGVLRQVGREAHDLGAACGQLHQCLAERRGLHALPFRSDRRDHRRRGQARLLLGDGTHLAAPCG